MVKGGQVFTPRTGHAAVALGDRFFLFGGSDNENILNDTYIYSLQKKIWTQLMPLSAPDS
jgi:hypothetical protein